VNHWQILEKFSYTKRSCFQEEQVRSILELLDLVCKVRPKDVQYYLEPVNTKQYKSYFNFVIIPVDISLITKRLENGYYRSKESVFFDIETLCDNAHKFNNDTSVICDAARTLKRLLMLIIDNFDKRDEIIEEIFPNKKALK
jgi:hypothetical protein